MAYQPDPLLVFKEPASKVTSHLVFGEYDAPASATAKVSLVLQLDPVRLLAQIGYDNNVFRDPAPSLAMGFEAAGTQRVELAAPLIVAAGVEAEVESQLTIADSAGVGVASPLWPSPAASTRIGVCLKAADAVSASADQALQAGLFVTAQTGALLTAADARGAAATLPLEWGLRAGLDLTTGLTPANVIAIAHHSSNHEAAILTAQHESWLQSGMQPKPGRSWIDPGINPPIPVCYTPSAKLVFQDKGRIDAHLVFVCDNALAPGEPKRIIPIRSAYIVINHVTLIRVDTGRELVCEALDISVDADSWTCAWSATLAWSEFDALRAERGQPVEMLASLNGHSYKLLMEGAPARQRSFGKWGVSIRGRGIAAALDNPYQDVSVRSNPTQAMTAQQLMADALTINGVSNGWASDWQITDWLVPAGAWSHQGTPIAAVLEVASAVGAIVQAADAAKTLRILPRYPIKPWAWATANPDIQIPLDVMATDSIEPSIKPAYNAVYVGGQAYGVTAFVKRQGTAGDMLAQAITHPLLTAAEATRQRGIAVLGDTGAQERIGMSLPLSDDTGLIRLNMLADVPDPDDPWRGLVRSVALSAKWQEGGLAVWQNINLERHYDN